MSPSCSNEFWECRFTPGDVQVCRRGQAALTFCSVPALIASAPEQQGPNTVQLAWHAQDSPLRLQLLIRLNGPSLLWELSTTALKQPLTVRLPFLEHTFTEQQQFQSLQGKPIFRHVDWPLPVVREADDGDSLTLLLTPDSAPGIASVTLQPDSPSFSGEVIAHRGGWRAAFDLLRQRVRQRFDLSEYQRPDLAWYQDQLVQHHTILYGREIFNRQTGQFELDRFLDEAERDFGGYDGMLIWGVYPRLGIDERTQWDFYDDFPGGRAGLRAMSRRARERGVRFYVPYKPWDRSAELHGHPGPPDSDQLAQLIADVEADGVFLDTMSAIDPAFRTAIDQQRPGVVFCSEGRAKDKAFETITGSWDQTLHRDTAHGNWSAQEETMPGVDLWRFIFPEHRLFVINRHAVADDRLRIIQRGFFSGTGWVVWQDIFGLVLSYTPAEAALLKKCRTLFKGHKAALNGPAPTPLIPTLQRGVTCNEFPANGPVRKCLWTFYNETDQVIDGPILQIEPHTGSHFVDIWNNCEINPDAEGRLSISLAPRSLGAVVEFPRLLSVSQGNIQAEPIEGAQIHVNQTGFEGSTVTLTEARPMTISLVLGDEILDQIIIGAS